ncbi:Protein of unknown function [Streptococcus thermophilus]|nr:Protein of unknown function [Streptococcus thermophilus]
MVRINISRYKNGDQDI